jgi:SAM-dependent methyltransferase
VYADPRVQTEFEDRYSAMLSRAQQRAGSLESVLDVGCGIGNFLAFAEQRGLRAFGIDIESEAVEVARQRGYAATVSGELDALVPDRSLDAVSLWDVIEHLYDPDPVLRQSLAKLRSPGGVVLLETPDGRFWIRPLVLLLRRLTRGKLDVSDYMYYWEHKIYFSKAGMRAILARHGCRVVDVHRLPSPRQKMSKILGRDAGKSVPARLIASLWPLLEGASTRLGRGNKLMVVAVLDSRPDDLQPHPA